MADVLYAPVDPAITEQIDRTKEWLDDSSNMFLPCQVNRYPRQLLEIADPPLILYVKGRVELLTSPSIAIVGSRNATTQGRLDAEEFAHSLSDTGLTIVSGLALGIDTAAHEGGLKGRGSTVAVIGTGSRHSLSGEKP